MDACLRLCLSSSCRSTSLKVDALRGSRKFRMQTISKQLNSGYVSLNSNRCSSMNNMAIITIAKWWCQPSHFLAWYSPIPQWFLASWKFLSIQYLWACMYANRLCDSDASALLRLYVRSPFGSRLTTRCQQWARGSFPSQSQIRRWKIWTRNFPLVVSRTSVFFQLDAGCCLIHLSTRIDSHWAFGFAGLRPLFDVGGGITGFGSSR